MERIIKFHPAYDKRDPDPSKNYGIHGVEIRFLLKGEHGAVQFLIYTDWQLPHIQRDKSAFPPLEKFGTLEPWGVDLGYHSDKPIRDYHKETRTSDDDWNTPSRECPYTTSGRCYYDGSGLNAERLVAVLLSEGDSGIWRELEEYYHRTFGDNPVVNSQRG